ncbi:hypothetical protein [Winogradskyella ursingii]|uniref:hypothetical protein n=1 Tax=Winogradskyella ursingii TaxID=2686079 RepID=UPI0015C6B603|nr:hypothetical protein [Winogradskyella ursingii]
MKKITVIASVILFCSFQGIAQTIDNIDGSLDNHNVNFHYNTTLIDDFNSKKFPTKNLYLDRRSFKSKLDELQFNFKYFLKENLNFYDFKDSIKINNQKKDKPLEYSEKNRILIISDKDSKL